LFWYYLQQVESAPELTEEYSYPLIYMSHKEMSKCAFRVIVYRNRIAVEFFHALTDGTGVLPYIKSTMFLYLSKVTGQAFDPAGFCLPGDVIPESETGNPFSKLDVDSVKAPLYKKKPIPDFFRLSDGVDSRKTVFYVKLSERQVMQYCREYDGSPNVLISVLLAKAARRWNPESEKTITVSVCIDHKAMLGIRPNYRMFVGEALLDFPKARDMKDIAKACTIARGQLMLQAQPENSLWEIKKMKQMLACISLASYSINVVQVRTRS
jgi:hypothetical protein